MAKDLESFEPTKWSEAGIKAVIRPLIEERLEIFRSSVEKSIEAVDGISEDEILALRREFKDGLDEVKEDVLEAARIDKQDMIDYVNRALVDLIADQAKKGGREEDIKVWVDRRIHQFIDEYHIRRVTENIEDDENVDDEDVETLKRIFRNYPKSLLWMTAGLFVGIGTGHLFTAIGIWGTLLVLGWISDGTKLSFSKKRDPWSL